MDDPISADVVRHEVYHVGEAETRWKEAFGEESDVDILVSFQPGARVSFLTLARLQRELSSLLNCPVDLVPERGLKPLIRDGLCDC